VTVFYERHSSEGQTAGLWDWEGYHALLCSASLSVLEQQIIPGLEGTTQCIVHNEGACVIRAVQLSLCNASRDRMFRAGGGVCCCVLGEGTLRSTICAACQARSEGAVVLWTLVGKSSLLRYFLLFLPAVLWRVTRQAGYVPDMSSSNENRACNIISSDAYKQMAQRVYPAFVISTRETVWTNKN
jgi:hypothetical protein